MRTGIVILPEYRRGEAEARWRRAEAYGFDHAWTFDHLGWRSLVDGPWFGAVPTLAVAATVTSRMEIGPLVASPNFRHPVAFAREVIALDDISAGRFILGVGAGTAHAYDTKVLGEPELTNGRTRRFEEFVTLLDALLTSERTTWRGRFYSAVEARSAPGCMREPRLPFVIAANGPRAMRLAARFGQGWITTGLGGDDLEAWWQGIAQAAGRFDDALGEHGRARGDVRRFLQTDSAPEYSLSSTECYRDFLGRAGELGFTDVVAPWPRHEGVFAGSETVLETVAADVLPTLRI